MPGPELRGLERLSRGYLAAGRDVNRRQLAIEREFYSKARSKYGRRVENLSSNVFWIRWNEAGDFCHISRQGTGWRVQGPSGINIYKRSPILTFRLFCRLIEASRSRRDRLEQEFFNRSKGQRRRES